MKPWRSPKYKVRNDQRQARKHGLLTERSALLLTMALLAVAGSASLLRAAHEPVPMIIITSASAFAAAMRLLDDLIG